MTPVLSQSPEEHASALARLRAAMNAAGDRCEGCGMALCRACRGTWGMTGQHVSASGTCPNGHRVPAITEKGSAVEDEADDGTDFISGGGPECVHEGIECEFGTGCPCRCPGCAGGAEDVEEPE
jgi:hypothetical protein